jgi:hypothetical protein
MTVTNLQQMDAFVAHWEKAGGKERANYQMFFAELCDALAAAKRDWRNVEPAIFGTLLERALDSKERSKLGAHYTPRSYVERLVRPVVMEPLRDRWEIVQEAEKLHFDAMQTKTGFFPVFTLILDPTLFSLKARFYVQ